MPSWAVQRLRRQDAAPLALVESDRGMRLLAAVCPAAAAAGLRPGSCLADARAILPDLVVLDADPEGDRASLARLAAWCERYTPLAAVDPPDGLWLDIAGCAHIWEGEAGIAEDLRARLTRTGVVARIAVADTAGAAWALARAPGEDILILPPGRERTALRDLRVEALRIEARTTARLRRLGLRTVGEMARIPRAEFSTRFGPQPLLRLDQALGDAPEAIAWPHPLPPWEERLAFAEPILTAEDLTRALGLLADRLCQRLALKDSGATQFEAEFFRVDSARPSIGIGTALPMREAPYVARLLAAKLEGVDPGYGVEVVRLLAGGVAALGRVQAGLDSRGARDDAFPAVLDQLASRLSPHRVWRAAPYASHVPERAVVGAAPIRAPTWEADSDSPRPVRLFCRPETIEATALMPDDPPTQFRWRGVLHRVRAATGPERIAREWWRSAEDGDDRPEADRVRDYYQVEDEAGGRFWLFRVGLQGQPRWFLHGLFG